MFSSVSKTQNLTIINEGKKCVLLILIQISVLYDLVKGLFHFHLVLVVINSNNIDHYLAPKLKQEKLRSCKK